MIEMRFQIGQPVTFCSPHDERDGASCRIVARQLTQRAERKEVYQSEHYVVKWTDPVYEAGMKGIWWSGDVFQPMDGGDFASEAEEKFAIATADNPFMLEETKARNYLLQLLLS